DHDDPVLELIAVTAGERWIVKWNYDARPARVQIVAVDEDLFRLGSAEPPRSSAPAAVRSPPDRWNQPWFEQPPQVRRNSILLLISFRRYRGEVARVPPLRRRPFLV